MFRRFMAASSRLEVLSLYKRILRMSQTWVAKDPLSSIAEQEYILNEAKTMFRKNKDVSSADTVKALIQEGHARTEIALHYRNPYPRPANVPPKALAKKDGRSRSTDSERFKKLG